jgi:hypothetical protein
MGGLSFFVYNRSRSQPAASRYICTISRVCGLLEILLYFLEEALLILTGVRRKVVRITQLFE